MIKDFDVGPIMKQLKKNKKGGGMIQPMMGSAAPETNDEFLNRFEIPSLPEKILRKIHPGRRIRSLLCNNSKRSCVVRVYKLLRVNHLNS